MAAVGIVGGLGLEATVDYYRRILAAWEREYPSSAPSIVIDSLDAQRALRLVAADRPAFSDYLFASLQRLAGAGVNFRCSAPAPRTSSSTISAPVPPCRS